MPSRSKSGHLIPVRLAISQRYASLLLSRCAPRRRCRLEPPWQPDEPPSLCTVSHHRPGPRPQAKPPWRAPRSELAVVFFIHRGPLPSTDSSGRSLALSMPPWWLPVLGPPPRTIDQPPTTADRPLHVNPLWPPAPATDSSSQVRIHHSDPNAAPPNRSENKESRRFIWSVPHITLSPRVRRNKPSRCTH
jgi:hypothetical protein